MAIIIVTRVVLPYLTSVRLLRTEFTNWKEWKKQPKGGGVDEGDHGEGGGVDEGDHGEGVEEQVKERLIEGPVQEDLIEGPV